MMIDGASALTQPVDTMPGNRVERSLVERLRTLALPIAINNWAALLYVSQKVFVVPALILIGAGDAAYRRDLIFALIATIAGGLVYLSQPWNDYRDVHFIGFLFFVWSMPPLNHAVRREETNLLKWLTYASIFNVALGAYFLLFNVDLQEFRGLNRIETSDGYTARLFFEAVSLSAVVYLGAFRRPQLKMIALVAISVFVLIIARSVVVAALLALNLAWPYLIRSSVVVKASVAVAAMTMMLLALRYLPELRPDLYLSIYAKEYQFTVITSLQQGWTGWGWGSFVPQLANDIDQPYQIEMQLPMLLLQLGPVALAVLLACMFALFLSAGRSPALSGLRFAIYCFIGFNNPWLFLPSWFLTCQLLFRTHLVSETGATLQAGRHGPP